MSDARDIVERLRANPSKYPGFVNLNEEAAAEIERLRESLGDCRESLRIEVLENEKLRKLAFHTGPGEFSPEGWTWRQQAACDRVRMLEAEAALAMATLAHDRKDRDQTAHIRELEAALAVAVDEADTWRFWHDGEFSGTGPMMEASTKVDNARAATDANELIRQYRASREQTR